MANERCPEDIPGAQIIDFPINGKNYRLCERYEKDSNLTGLVPSVEFCPSCKYNGVYVRKQADDELLEKLKNG